MTIIIIFKITMSSEIRLYGIHPQDNINLR